MYPSLRKKQLFRESCGKKVENDQTAIMEDKTLYPQIPGIEYPREIARDDPGIEEKRVVMTAEWPLRYWVPVKQKRGVHFFVGMIHARRDSGVI